VLKKVISGGQTGVARAGLDAALNAGFPVGGFCPKGRKAEDGIIPEIYPLEEIPSSSYFTRTEQNVIGSDGTLIVTRGDLSGGTKYTREYSLKHSRPYLIVQFDPDNRRIEPPDVIRWLQGQQINVLNIAGPRESRYPEGIYEEAYQYLNKVFTLLKETYQWQPYLNWRQTS